MLRSNVMTLLICGVACLTASCADTYAAEGAKSGAVGGAVAGAVLGVFTGNVGASMVAGAAASAAAGAAIGGMTPKAPQGGAPAPAPAEGQGNSAPADPKLVERQQALEKKIGPANFDAARMLALCRAGRSDAPTPALRQPLDYTLAVGALQSSYSRALCSGCFLLAVTHHWSKGNSDEQSFR